MASRAVIEQAKDVWSAPRRCTTSRRSSCSDVRAAHRGLPADKRTMRDLAQDLADPAGWPQHPAGRPPAAGRRLRPVGP